MGVKAVLALLLSLFATAALAQPCVAPLGSFSQSFYGPDKINGFVYDQPGANLYVTWRQPRQYTLYIRVPVGVAQAFTRTTMPDAFAANTLPPYPQVLETEACGALLSESNVKLLSQHIP